MAKQFSNDEERRAYHAAASQRYRDKHPEKAKASSTQNHELHRTQDRLRAVQFRQLNPKYQKDWQERNPGLSLARYRRYHLNHPEQGHIDRARRRARKLQSSGFCTVQQWVERVVYFGCRCFYCKKDLTWEPKQPNTLTQDHLIPLSRGGSNWPSNLVPACLGCNLKKSNKILAEM